MTKLAVSIMVQSLAQGLADAARAAELGAELIEFRLDQFTAKPSYLTELVQRAPLPCIITCRLTSEGGSYDGDDQSRIALLQQATAGPRKPAYIDVELATYQRSEAFRQQIDQLVDHPGQIGSVDTGLILSTHDFKGRPVDVYQRVEAMVAASACRVMKVVWQARSLRDPLEMFEIVRSNHKPTIGLCMGEHGLPSRVLTKKFGALLTFASLNQQGATAPGQPTIEQLKLLYRWDRMNAQTHVFGVIGHPVGHSLGPYIHNAGFEAIGFDGVYLPMPIPPEYEHFKATVDAWLQMPDLHFQGASVTLPHKQNLVRFVREQGGQIEALADRIGSANTLTRRADGSLYASNTDYAAALDAICDVMAMGREQLKDQRVAVLGAGGVARAIVAGLASYGATVVIYNRTLERAEQLASAFNSLDAKVVPARLEKLCDSCCSVLINCTPLGMSPGVDQSPLPSAGMSNWGAGTVVFDTIYNPDDTCLLREARAAGCMTIPGKEMFLRQAAAQFKLWTNTKAPIEIFRRVLNQHLT
jgi:3-dehydroquinate dehydratase/shikimate dehydrogenase